MFAIASGRRSSCEGGEGDRDFLRCRVVLRVGAGTNFQGAILNDADYFNDGDTTLSGPGAITTVILLNNQARGLVQHMVLLVCIVAVSASSFLVLRLAAHGARWLNPIALNITTRLMGLLLAAVACQFIVNAFKDLKVIPA